MPFWILISWWILDHLDDRIAKKISRRPEARLACWTKQRAPRHMLPHHRVSHSAMHEQTRSFLSCRAAFLPYYSTSTLKAKILGHVFFVKESMWFAAAHTQRAIFERPLCANTWGPYSPPPHQAGIHFASRLISPTKAFEKCQIRE